MPKSTESEDDRPYIKNSIFGVRKIVYPKSGLKENPDGSYSVVDIARPLYDEPKDSKDSRGKFSLSSLLSCHF